MLSGIKVGNCWGCVVGDVPVEQVDDHFAGDSGVEFFDWFSNVAQKGITGSAANHHDKNIGQPPRNIVIAAPERME